MFDPVRSRVLASIAQLKDHLDEPGWLPPADPELVRLTEQLLITSFLMGMDHAGSTLDLSDPGPDDFKPVTFDEAIAFLKGRVPLKKSEWNDLEEKLRFRAFTVARLTQGDAVKEVNKVRTQLIKSMTEGQSMAEFWNESRQAGIVGFDESKPWYWETVYRTNVQTSYNAGRAMEFLRNQPPYLEFVGMEDSRQTDICAPRSGVIRPATDPWWKNNWPPLHFNCRSTIRGIFQDEIDERLEENPNWGPTSDKLLTQDKPAKGFGRNPVESGNYWMLTPSQVQRAAEYGVLTMFNKSGNVISDYDQLWKGWKRYPGKHGGWVDVTPDPPSDIDKTLPAFKILADFGHRCKILPAVKDVPGFKNPEGYIDGVLSELKTPGAFQKKAINKLFSKASIQGVSQVVLELPEILDTNSEIEVYRAIKSYFSPNSGTSKIKQLIILKGMARKIWTVLEINSQEFRV